MDIKFYKKLDKLLDCEGVLIIKGLENWETFKKTFFPEDDYTSVYMLRNIQVLYSHNPNIRQNITIVELDN